MKALLITISFLLPTVLLAQLDRSVRPKAAAAPTINIKDSEVFKTANGITVILSENHKLPKVSFRLSMNNSAELEGDMAGLSGIAGSLIMSGTSNKSKDELDAEIDYVGANLRAGSSSLSLSCLTKHMDKGLSLMSDVLLNANFPQSEVDRIIKQNESGLLSAKSDAGTMSRNAASTVNFPNHPYGEVMTEATLANINRDAIVAYYKKTFTPKGSYLVVVGDINKEQATAAVEKYFGSWTGEMAKTNHYSSAPGTEGNRVIFVKKPGAVQSVISVTSVMNIDPSHEDYLKLKVLNSLLGGGVFGNRLMQNLREDKAFTYGCRSSINVDEEGSYMSAGGNFRNEVTDSAITEILYELERITTELVEDDEINLTKSFMAGSFARSLEQPSTIARFALDIIKYDLAKDYYQTYLKQLDAVTKQDLLDVAKKYFTSKNCNIIVVGSEDVLDKLKQFDADGVIEKLDAFGKEVKEMLPADISKDELLAKYMHVVTVSSSDKAMAKKLKKVKSFEEVIELTMAQVPFPMKNTQVWKAPNTSGMKMEGQGMVFQKSFFDGVKGSSTSMQTGKSELTQEEIDAKNKSIGLFPELNYSSSGMKYELLGIENRDGKDCYVLKLEDGKSESYDYFDKVTLYKIATVKIEKDGEETKESTMSYSNFSEQDGFIFPMNINITAGQMNLSGKVISRTINAKVDFSSYE